MALDANAELSIKIHLTTQIEQDGQFEQHVFDVTGQLIRMGTTLYLRYHEMNTETSAAVPVTLKLQEDGLIILTRGQDETRLQLRFALAHEIETVYQTPYGNVPIITRTTMMKVRLQNEPTTGEIALDYVLLSSHQQLGKYQLRLIFQQ
ncbi:DUF1934 domain-containing protein [Lapidilactobacillus bayanensis]|uniref:DUF1934 domain-containing protein n=1 Tax=Lapidilactobacillus bayanensis TaxID=2485998 RepID=UPI000F78CB34|nr:DUF1934 domain-containing protein [Lapidilactobacillus bayanensis]